MDNKILQLMVRMSIFDKTNYLLIVDAFENVFQRRSSEVLLPDVLTIRKIEKYCML